jgi:hypothetical protein
LDQYADRSHACGDTHTLRHGHSGGDPHCVCIAHVYTRDTDRGSFAHGYPHASCLPNLQPDTIANFDEYADPVSLGDTYTSPRNCPGTGSTGSGTHIWESDQV